MHAYVHCSTIYNSKDVELTQMPINGIEWIRKMWHVFTMEYYVAIKQNNILSFAATQLELEAIILSKLTQTGTENQIPHVLTCRWKLNVEYIWIQRGEQ